MQKIAIFMLVVLTMSSLIPEVKGEELSEMNFQLFSKAFNYGGTMPDLYSYTRKGKNLSPPLHWTNIPSKTKSFALIVEDTFFPFYRFTHWVIYNIPAEKKELAEGIPMQEIFPDGTIQGRNGYKKNMYVGPHPMMGKAHEYHFILYALDTVLQPDPRMAKKQLMKAMDQHILGTARLVGCYSRD